MADENKKGILWNGVCITANFSESPKAESGCILSDILEEDVSEKYFLSPAAMARILSSLSQAPRDSGFTMSAESPAPKPPEPEDGVEKQDCTL